MNLDPGRDGKDWLDNVIIVATWLLVACVIATALHLAGIIKGGG
jgi:hypothetical protein